MSVVYDDTLWLPVTPPPAPKPAPKYTRAQGQADIALIADVRPDTIEPIRMPTNSVRHRNADANSLRRRAQPKISRTCCPIACLLLSSRKKIPAVTKYNTSIHDGLRMHSAAAEPILYERPGIEMFSVAAVRFAGIVLLKL